eukprot:2954579-Amphidinium_carterae.1
MLGDDVLGLVDAEDVLVSVVVVTLAMLGDAVPELADADVVERVDVLREILGNIGVVDLVVYNVELVDDLRVFVDVFVDADVVTLVMLGDEVLEVVDAEDVLVEED